MEATNGAVNGVNRRGFPGRQITINGETKTIPAWARQFGISPYTVYQRIWRGVPVETALTTPARPRAETHRRMPRSAPTLAIETMDAPALLSLRAKVDEQLRRRLADAEAEVETLRSQIAK